MKRATTPRNLLTVSNGISLFRALAALVLIGLAATGRESAFLILLALALASDLFDGWAARILGEASELGSRVDGWCDRILFLSMVPSLGLLRPELFRSERPFIVLVIVAHAVPVLFSLRKFGLVASYHTCLSKVSVGAIAAAFFILLFFDWTLPWRVVAVGQLAVAAELLVLTMRLDAPRTDVPSLWHLRRGG